MDRRKFLALIGTASLASVEDSSPSRATAANSTSSFQVLHTPASPIPTADEFRVF